MAYRRLDYALAARSLPEDHPHAIHIKLPTPVRSTLTRKPSFISKLKAKISRKGLRGELYDDDAASLNSRYWFLAVLLGRVTTNFPCRSVYSQDVEDNLDGARGRRSALAIANGDDTLMADAMKKHEEQKAMFRAPSKHAIDPDAVSRGVSTNPSTQGTANVSAIGPSPSKTRICTELATWAQYPSHTRADRCGSAGRADAMNIIDFGDPSRLRFGAVTPADKEPPPINSLRRRTTNMSKRSSKKRRGLVKSTSQGLERVGRYYSNLFATANFRGNNRRTSVSASTGVLVHPELEMLAPATALESHQPVHEHLKRVDEDLGMLSSAFRMPSFSKFGHHHDKGTGQEDDERSVGPDEEETPVVSITADPVTPTREQGKKIEWNMPSMPFRKLSTFFLVESKSNKGKGATNEDDVPVSPEEDEPPFAHVQLDGEHKMYGSLDGPSFGPLQLDGATNDTDTDTIDTLDAIEGAERKSG